MKNTFKLQINIYQTQGLIARIFETYSYLKLNRIFCLFCILFFITFN